MRSGRTPTQLRPPHRSHAGAVVPVVTRTTTVDRDQPRSVVTRTSNATARTTISTALLDDADARLTGTVVGPVGVLELRFGENG